MLYWNRSAKKGEKDVRHHVKGKNGYVTKLLSVFQIAFRNAFEIITEKGKGGERIHLDLWRYREGKNFNFSFKQKENRECKEAFVRIPIIATNKYSRKQQYFSIKTIAQRIPHILLKETTREKRLFLKRRIGINFLLMIKHIEDKMESTTNNNVWKELKEIVKNYDIDKNPRITEKDWARIILLIFPELLIASRLIPSSHAEKSNKKNLLKNLDLLELENRKPNPEKLLMLFPAETRTDWHIRTPFSAFFNIFGYLLGTKWSVYYKKSGKFLGYPLISYNKPDIIIEPIYDVIIPWIIKRAESLKNRFNVEHYCPSAIQNLRDEEFLRIMKYAYKEILEGKIQEDGNIRNIPIFEKLTWFLIWETYIIDTLSFNLDRAYEYMEHIILMFENFETIDEVANNLDQLLSKFKEAIV
jgi:hypothetical protein